MNEVIIIWKAHESVYVMQSYFYMKTKITRTQKRLMI